MFLSTQLACGVSLSIQIPAQTTNRLSGTCFRGKRVQKAGNFFKWENATQLFADTYIKSEFVAGVEEEIEADGAGSYSMTIICRKPIGWESTQPRYNYYGYQLEAFYPNSNSQALRIIPSLKGIRAPKTNLVTFVYSLAKNKNGWFVIIYSIYPGEDIGELIGDITKRENRIFFSWDHPGQT